MFLDPETQFVSARHVDAAGWTGDPDDIVVFHMLHHGQHHLRSGRSKPLIFIPPLLGNPYSGYITPTIGLMTIPCFIQIPAEVFPVFVFGMFLGSSHIFSGGGPGCLGYIGDGLNSHRNDSMIMHPLIAQRIVNMTVDKKHQIDVHVPLFVDIQCHYENPQIFNWNIPKSWAHMAPPKDLLHQTYETMRTSLHIPDQFTTALQAEELLIEWSRIAENSVDKALQIQHVEDPLLFPVPCLPSSFKGRCRPQQRTAIQPKTSVKNDRHQGYQPPMQ